MSDQLKLQTAVTFVQQSPPETVRLIDTERVCMPTGYANGMLTTNSNDVDVMIVDGANIFIMTASKGITLKIGTTTALPLLNLTEFSYRGQKTVFFISNPTTEAIAIKYASASE
jgi:hypothetical protein